MCLNGWSLELSEGDSLKHKIETCKTDWPDCFLVLDDKIFPTNSMKRGLLSEESMVSTSLYAHGTLMPEGFWKL